MSSFNKARDFFLRPATQPKIQRRTATVLEAVGVVALTALSAAAGQTKSQPQPSRQAVAAILTRQPLHFERATGAGRAFVATGPGYSLAISPNSTTIVRWQSAADSSIPQAPIKLNLLGASFNAQAEPLQPLASTNNYFIGSDPAAWRTAVPQFGKLRYAGIYPGIDVLYYGHGNSLEHDFLISPGADPTRIRLQLDVSRPALESSGDLVVQTSAGTVRLLKPIAYQESGETRVAVESSYRIDANGDIAFSLGAYDTTRPLIIDPILSYATTFGFLDVINAIAVDSSGNIYITGQASPYGITTRNPVVAAGTGTYNVFVSKINPSTNSLVFSTYLGGSKVDEGFGITLDGLDNVFVTGATDSPNFPLMNAAEASLPGSSTCSTLSSCGTAFVAGLKGDGSALLYSTYLGGSTQEAGYAIAADATGNAYVTGVTQSSNFPLKSALYSTFNGGYSCSLCTDAFVTKYNLAGQVQYSTYLGGIGSDAAYGIALDTSGDAFVTGIASGGFPLKNPVSLAGTVIGNSTSGGVMITEINPDGSALVFSNSISSGLGGSIALDILGAVYVTGTTSQPNVSLNYTPGVPTTPGALNTTSGGSFVFKLSADGSTMVYSTLLGGNATDYANGIAVDSSGDAWVAGYTTSNNFPTANPVVPQGGGYFYASSNGGTSFAPANSGLLPLSTQMVFDPNNPGTLTAGQGSSGISCTATNTNCGGLFTSTNVGASWTRISPTGLTDVRVTQIARSKSTPTTLYVLTPSGFFRSTNNGTSYTLATGTGIPTLTNPVFTIDPFTSTTLYLESSSNILYTSTDGGNTWSANSTTFPANRNLFPIVADPLNQGTLYTICNSLIWKSTNGGSTWTSSAPGFTANSLTLDPNNPTTIYATTNFTPFYKSTDGGVTWTASSGLAGSNSKLVVDPTNSQNVYVFFNPGSTYLSTNGGTSFSITTFSGLPSIDPTNNQNMYIATGLRNTGFLSELNPTGTALLFSTYAGGTYHSQYEAVALDPTGNAYVAGLTDSKDAPSTTGGVAPSVVEAPVSAMRTSDIPSPTPDFALPVDLSSVTTGNGTTNGTVFEYALTAVLTATTTSPQQVTFIPGGGQTITWTITLTNTSEAVIAQNITLFWNSPAGTLGPATFVQGPFTCGRPYGPFTDPSCTLASLGAGASATVSFTNYASDYLGLVTDHISVGCPNANTSQANASNSSTLVVAANSATLSVKSTASQRTYAAGTFAALEWANVTVSNAGPSTAVAPVVTVTAPAGASSISIPPASCPGGYSSSGTTATCTLADQPAGSSLNLYPTFVTTGPTMQYCVNALSTTPNGNPGGASICNIVIIPAPTADLAVDAFAYDGLVGEHVTAHARNRSGVAEEGNVTLTVGTGFSASIPSNNFWCPGGVVGNNTSSVTCVTQSLPPGGDFQNVFFDVSSTAGTTTTFNVSISGALPDPNLTNNTSSGTLTIPTSPPSTVVIQNGNCGLTFYSPPSSPFTTTPSSGCGGAGGGLAVDNHGNVFQGDTNFIDSVTSTGASRTPFPFYDPPPTNSLQNIPIAVDAYGTIIASRPGYNSVVVLSGTGYLNSPSGGFTGGGLNIPSGIAVDPSGSVLVTNFGNNTVTRILGFSAPTVAPLATGVANGTGATKP